MSLRAIEAGLQRNGIIPMQPGLLGQIAQVDPQLANALIGGGGGGGGGGRVGEEPIRPDLLGWGEPSCGWGWQILNVSGRFTSGAANQNIPYQLAEGIVEVDLWVRKITYTVQRPNAFAGNIFKAQSDYYNRLNPNINFTMIVKSYCRYVIAPTETPLENIEQVFECVCPIGFVLGCNSQFSGNFTNLRAFEDDEVPTITTITLHTVRLPTRYDSCGMNEAVANLQKHGILQEMADEWKADNSLEGAPKPAELGEKPKE